MQEFLPYLPVLGALVGLLSLAGAFRAGKRRRLIDNLPTSKTTGVFIGLVELKGTAESARPLTSYLAQQPCVFYEWQVQEHWSRTVTETYTDSEGKTQTRTRQESGWTTVGDGRELIPFYLQDDCGVVLVRPEGAKLEPVGMFDQTCSPNDPLYAKGPEQAISNSDYRRRFTETGIPLHAELYVLGQARERQDVVAPEIAQDPAAPMFLVSTRSEDQVSSSYGWAEQLWGAFGLLAAVGSVIGRDASLGVPLEGRVPLYVAAGLGYLMVGVLLWVWMVFNSLVDLRNRVRQGWSLVDVQLKRRHDLIPNLVSVIQGYRGYEQQVQTELAALRTQLAATPPGVAGPDYAALSRVSVALVERYPDLKANQSFLALQKNLIDTEQRIALARGYYNDIATHYNTRLESVPEKFVARLGGFAPQTLMAANEFERAPVKVDLQS